MARTASTPADAIAQVRGIISEQEGLISEIASVLEGKVGGGLGPSMTALNNLIGGGSADNAMSNGFARSMTDEPIAGEWSGVRPVADGASIKDGVAFVARLKGKTVGGVNSKPEAIVSGVGRNLWNEQWKLGTLDGEGKESTSSRQIINVGYIPIPKDKTLYICGKTSTLNFYDENKVQITRYTSLSKTKDCIIDLPEGTRYIRFRVDDVTSYVDPICINISDSENGTYSPWVESRLDIVLPSIFADGLASAGDIYDEIDYLHNVAIKRVGVAEPIIEPIDAKAWYKVASGGSEEAVCGNGVPLVAEIAYRKDYTEMTTDYELAKTLI